MKVFSFPDETTLFIFEGPHAAPPAAFGGGTAAQVLRVVSNSRDPTEVASTAENMGGKIEPNP